MTKFLKKTAWFVVPAFLMLLLTEIFYTDNNGDLFRMSYLADTFNYNQQELFKEDFARDKHFTRVAELNLKKKHKVKYLIVGDSFSDIGNVGYYNHLDNDSTATLLFYVDRYINPNPLEILQGLINGNFFDNVEAEYIVLQSVERDFVRRRIINKERLITTDTITATIKRHKKNAEKLVQEEASKDKLFINRNLKFVANNLLYNFDDNAFFNDVYYVDATEKLFSSDKKKILFFSDDLSAYDDNSNLEYIKGLNNELNELSAKVKKYNSKLLVVPAPDKFGVYHGYIADKEKYKYSGFSEKLNAMDKSYLFIDSKTILTGLLKTQKDVYYFNDTHWSPAAARAIASEIVKKTQTESASE